MDLPIALADILGAVISLWSSVIAAGGVIFGVLITGTFALLAQRHARLTDAQRWEREAAERRGTRFQEQRLALFSEFAEAAGSAFGYAGKLAIAKHGDLPDGTRPATVPRIRALKMSESATDTNETSVRRMTQLRAKIVMLAGTTGVRDAAESLTQSVLAILLVHHDHPEWNAEISDAFDRYQVALTRYLDLARGELTT